MKTIIETERIILRHFCDDDAVAVFEFDSNEAVVRWTGEPALTHIDQARDIINDIWKPEYEKYGYARYAVVHKQDQKVIGFAGLKFLPEFGEADLGYRMLPQYWGQGLASEMAVSLVVHAFDDLGLKKILGFAMPENPASCRVLEKAGFHFDKFAEIPGEEVQANWYSIDSSCSA